MVQKKSSKEDSIKQLRIHLQHLTEDLNKTTAHLQLMEMGDASNTSHVDSEVESEISRLIRKQNIISHEIITVRKRIQKLSVKTILKAELLILPVLVVLLFYVATNYSGYSSEQTLSLKTRYVVENLRGDLADNYEYWNVKSGDPLTVNIENYAHVSDEKINAVKRAILSTDMVIDDSSSFYHLGSVGKSEYFKGWQGALEDAGGMEHHLPEKFNVVESPNGVGDITIVLSSTNEPNGYSGFTKTITDGKQILKSFITIYNSDKLTNRQMETAIRHEFGHALGLPHANNPSDLMHDTTTVNSYISKCDVDTLKKLYSNSNPTSDYCT